MITLQEAKDYLGITDSASDSILNTLIGLSESQIEGYIDNKINPAYISGEAIVFDSSEFDLQPQVHLDLAEIPLEITLKYYPVISGVQLVTNDGDVLVEDEDYRLEASNGVITLLNYANGDVLDNLRASYWAGYNVCPEDLKYVALELVKDKFQRSGNVKRGKGSVKSKSIGNFSVTYQTASVMDDNKDILDGYKSVAI